MKFVNLGSISGILTIMISIISLVPSFLSLNKPKPLVYYTVEIDSVQTPRLVDDVIFEKFLKANQIPRSFLQAEIINLGNAPAIELKIALAVPGNIVKYSFEPDSTKKTAWVETPKSKDFGFGSKTNRIKEIIRNLSLDKKVVFTALFVRNSNEACELDVYFDGLPANQVTNLRDAPRWSPFSEFSLTWWILGIGVVITLFVIFISLVKMKEVE